jgi:hypothetical protein
MMHRSRPTGSGGGGVIVATATVALLLTAHSCSGGGCVTRERDVRTRCWQPLWGKIGRDWTRLS